MRDSTLSRKENLKKNKKNSTLEMHQITVLNIFTEAWEHNSDKVSIKRIRLHICNTTYANEERWSSGIPLHITDTHRNTVRTMYIVNMSLFIPHHFIINIDRYLNIYALYNYCTSTSKRQSSVILSLVHIHLPDKILRFCCACEELRPPMCCEKTTRNSVHLFFLTDHLKIPP